MTEEPTLADFLGGDDSEGDDESEGERDSDDGETLEDAGKPIESVDGEDEGVDDGGEVVDDGGEVVDDDSSGESGRAEVAPAVSTYAWGSYDCSSCGASVERVWRDAETFVCGSCKDW